jgi:cellulose synthase/poly-beta-1,6-N-acetylglucosamine synthase-like glycosyltransferase
MVDLLSYLLLAFAFIIAIPVFILFAESVAAVATTRREISTSKGGSSHRIAVLVPAHNEEIGIGPTLNGIKAQMRPEDRLVVVADNCTDNTAAIAAAARVEVTQRHDLTKVGKGYALDWGLRYLQDDPPSIVLIVDSDCRFSDGSVSILANACASTGKPVQALNLMDAPDESPIDYRVAMLAFRVKNLVRPLGLQAFNLPCQLMGTGMAFPWRVLSAANLATGSEVEDLKLGLELARTDNAPLFCPSARVLSQFPLSIEGAKSQRKRWERGHLNVIAKIIPSFLLEAIIKRNIGLLAMVFDAAVPPLTLLGLLVFLTLLLSAFGSLCGLSSLALTVSAVTAVAYASAVFVSWLRFGRDVLPLKAVISVLPYVIGKLSLYGQIFFRRRIPSHWVRTARGSRDSISTGRNGDSSQ